MTSADGHSPGQWPPSPPTPDDGLRAAREALPGWDIHDVFGGWLAVPAGTAVFHSTTLAALVVKARTQESGR